MLGASLLLLGCDKDEKDKADAENDVEETGVDPSKNPFGALKQLADAGKEMQEKAQKMQEHEPVEPVSFKALLPLLPSPKGWEKPKEPHAESTQMGEFRISTATQNYQKTEGKDRQTMKVSIVDGSYVPMVYAPFLMMSKFSREGTDGHSKGLKIGGHQAFEEWKKKPQRVTLTVLVKDRFLVTIEGRNVPANEARKWAKQLPLDKLSQWAKDEVTGDQVTPDDSADEAEQADTADEPADTEKSEAEKDSEGQKGDDPEGKPPQ